MQALKNPGIPPFHHTFLLQKPRYELANFMFRQTTNLASLTTVRAKNSLSIAYYGAGPLQIPLIKPDYI